MKRIVTAWLPLVLLACTGCWWISGPWVGQETLEKDYDQKIKIGMLREDVEDVLGEPSEELPVTDEQGNIPENSREAWLLYIYDYPEKPVLITLKVDRFGIVTEKHFDTPETVREKLGREKLEDEAYPGGPLRRFQELERLKQRGLR